MFYLFLPTGRVYTDAIDKRLLLYVKFIVKCFCINWWSDLFSGPLQLEKEFVAHRLGNWEVPKCYPQRPRARKTITKIIANDRGHLLPGVHRAHQSPWGNFKGTWQLPNKISRKLGKYAPHFKFNLSRNQKIVGWTIQWYRFWLNQSRWAAK